jgi:hypothetical protein
VIEAADSDLEVMMRADKELAEKIDNESTQPNSPPGRAR